MREFTEAQFEKCDRESRPLPCLATKGVRDRYRKILGI